MLRELRDAIAAEEGRPIRVEILARRLRMDPSAAAAMLEHARRRGLVTRAESCSTGACAAESTACRRCPLLPARESE